MTWQDHAVCNGKTDLFFAPFGERFHRASREAAARALCEACPVRAECLRDAHEEDRLARYPDGIRAGLTAQERADMREPSRRSKRHVHGEYSCYTKGCRCELCRGAKRMYRARQLGMTTPLPTGNPEVA